MFNSIHVKDIHTCYLSNLDYSNLGYPYLSLINLRKRRGPTIDLDEIIFISGE
jgi:hypothetical protein